MTALDAGRGLRTSGNLPRRRSDRAGGVSAMAEKGLPLLAAAFLISLAFPMFFTVSGLQLLPYRVVLLLAFVPMALRLLSGQAGGLKLHDGLLIAAVAWQCLAFLLNHGPSIIPGAGMQVVEVLGAWMLGRVAIRTAADFRLMVRILFAMVVVLAPFAMLEAVTKRPYLLEMLPMTGRPVWAPERFGLRRAQAVFSHPILYGVFVSATLGMVWYALNPVSGFLGRAVRAAIIFFAVFSSLSAGAIVAFVIQAALIAWEIMTRPNPNRWRTFAWLVGGTYVLLDILSNRNPFHLLVDYATFSPGASYNRILIWRYGTDVVWANPVFGIGRNDWARPFWMGDSVDNFWLLNAMQFGLPGLVLLAAAFFTLMRAVVRSRIDDPTEWACRAGWLTSLGGVIIAGGTVHYWTTMLSFVVFLFAAGSWLVREPPGTGPDGPASRRGGHGKRSPDPQPSRRAGKAPPSDVPFPLGAESGKGDQPSRGPQNPARLHDPKPPRHLKPSAPRPRPSAR